MVFNTKEWGIWGVENSKERKQAAGDSEDTLVLGLIHRSGPREGYIMAFTGPSYPDSQ